MADLVLQDGLTGEQGKMGGRHQTIRWTQPCIRQPKDREPKKWARSVQGIQSKVPKTHTSPVNAARERSRVRNLRQAFQSLQAALPSVPPDTKLSKLDVLVLATNYIAHLTETLEQGETTVCEHQTLHRAEGYLHPVKKWPMRSLLYCGTIGERLTGANSHHENHQPISSAEVKGE
ncbi:transcription factor 24 [Trichomycterus rosablanca]|uniref:transcription factor 24 n=1 Tax=Trichomycterus rosablanca TaxID=2290929 RepID=UPI002F3596B6